MFPLGHKAEHELNVGLPFPRCYWPSYKNISALAALSLNYKPIPIAVVLILLEHLTLFQCFKVNHRLRK